MTKTELKQRLIKSYKECKKLGIGECHLPDGKSIAGHHLYTYKNPLEMFDLGIPSTYTNPELGYPVEEIEKARKFLVMVTGA